uniref:Zinc metalloproteinase n=1 Tax=Panagrolaimus superbus TaxID=310955 RepID=A0A914YWC3_9BILA
MSLVKTKKFQRLKKFLSNFKNPDELEYIRQGLQTFRNQQQSKQTFNQVSTDDLQYIQNLQRLREQIDPKSNTSLKFQSIEESNKGLEDYLYEGDILLSPEQIDEMTNPRKKRQAMTLDYRWDKTKPIYYRFDSSLDPAVPPLFRIGAKFWNDNTCLNLVESNTATSIRVFDGTGQSTGCFSGVGRSTQHISISATKGCNHFGVITHEIAHALGIKHEQSRHDRDNYITTIPSNMNQFYFTWFMNDKLTASNSNNFGLPYDWGSIMHYHAVSDDGKIIAVAKDKIYQSTMGSRTAPSFKDIYLMNLYYNCLCSSGVTCQNGGFRHPKNCNSCICPSGFGGTVCNQRQIAENGAIDIGAVLTATSNYQTLSGKTGEPNKILQRAQAVYWHIYAPSGKAIEITVQSVNGYCGNGCSFGALELKVKNFLLVGARYCCPSDVAANPVLVTQGSFAIISLNNQAYGQGFTLKYRYGKNILASNLYKN